MPEFRVYERDLKRKYTITASSPEEIDPEVYDVLKEPTSDHLGPIPPEFDVTKSGKASAEPITDGHQAGTQKESKS